MFEKLRKIILGKPNQRRECKIFCVNFKEDPSGLMLK